MKKVTLTISDMHCTSCAMHIDGDLEDTKGVQEACTNYAKSQTEVTFDPQQLTEKELLTVIKKTGYTAKIRENM